MLIEQTLIVENNLFLQDLDKYENQHFSRTFRNYAIDYQDK